MKTIKVPGLSKPVALDAPICLQSPHFSWYEATKGGARIPESEDVTRSIIRIATALEGVRDKFGGRSITITSWYRPPSVNRAVGGARYSKHIEGHAVDILIDGLDPRDVTAKLSETWDGGVNDDDPYGRGLAHWLYWPTFFKRSDMRWWVTFLEKYAQPTRLGKYSPGASESDKDTLWQAMDAFGTNGKMMIPEGTMIELLEAARAGGADYQGMLDICNAAISKIVLSQTMTTDNGSSQSQANVHQDVKDDIVKADADLICSSFNEGPVKWLIDWNFPGVAYPRIWRQMDAAVDLTAEVDRDTKLQGLGISLKPESIAAKYGDDYLIPDNKEQIPQLNSEQVTALVSIVSNATQGGWSPGLVAGMINGAFPNWPGEAVAAITKNLQPPAPADQSVAPVDLDSVSAQFAQGWLDRLSSIDSLDELIPPMELDPVSAQFAQGWLDRLSSIDSLDELPFDTRELTASL